MLRTKKPRTIDDFIAGAKADGEASQAAPVSTATQNAAKPGKGNRTASKRKGKEAATFMPPADSENIKRYQVRVVEDVHREFKAEAAREGIGYADYLLRSGIKDTGDREAKRLGLTGTAKKEFVEKWVADRTVKAFREKGVIE